PAAVAGPGAVVAGRLRARLPGLVVVPAHARGVRRCPVNGSRTQAVHRGHRTRCRTRRPRAVRGRRAPVPSTPVAPMSAEAAATDAPAIRIDGVGKCYPVYERPLDRLRQFLAP